MPTKITNILLYENYPLYGNHNYKRVITNVVVCNCDNEFHTSDYRIGAEVYLSLMNESTGADASVEVPKLHLLYTS